MERIPYRNSSYDSQGRSQSILSELLKKRYVQVALPILGGVLIGLAASFIMKLAGSSLNF
jgi:hypothetical protein